MAESAGLRHGSVVLTLRNLERQRLAAEHDGASWSPTLFGRARVRHRRPN